MKKSNLLGFVLVAGALTVSAVGMAWVGAATGSIVTISLHDNTYGENDWFGLDANLKDTTCKKAGTFTPLMIQKGEPGNRMLALLNAAFLAGKKVEVGIDTTQVQNGFCRARYVRIIK